MLSSQDITKAMQARSDQLNGVDLLGGSLVAKIVDVRSGSSEQPVVIVIDSWKQPWKPSKTSLRVLSACWGNDPQVWIGRSVVLYCEESVKFGGVAVGGIRTSHLSHIDGVKKIAVNETRGKKSIQTVEPYYPEQQQPQAPQPPANWPDEPFEKKLAEVAPKMQSGERTPQQIIEAFETRAPLTAGQKARIERAAKPIEAPSEPDDDLPDPPAYEDEDPFAAG